MKKNTKNTKKTKSTSCATMCCPITCAPVKNLLIATVLGFLFIFGYSFVLHGHMLMPLYEQSKHLWRSVAEMENHFVFSTITQIITAFVVAGLYSHYCCGCGVTKGLRFGALIGLLFGTMGAAAYAWMPISWELAQAWFFGGFFEGLGLGVICWISFKSCDAMCEMK